MKTHILIIDDDQDFIDDITLLLNKNYTCSSAINSATGIKSFVESPPDIVLLDLMLNDGSTGLDVLKKIREEDSSIPVIMITDYSSVDTAIKAIKLGAFDYISKSPNIEELKLIIEKALKKKQSEYHKDILIEQTNKKFNAIVGNSIITQKLKAQIYLFSQNDNTILITGESGVGKELVARQIHQLSDRKNNPFIAINCAAIPNNLIESELFGHEKGAFTGAENRKPGKFEIAHEGTVFLDEVSEIDLDTQVKLLRVIQEREFEHLGSTKTIKVDIRIIAATNLDLKKLVEQKLFRDDLYYRLDVLPIEVPPLRERKEDIPELANHFLKISCGDLKIRCNGISDEAISLLKEYDWPGNVRELQNNIIRATILAGGNKIKPEHINSKLIPSRKVESLQIEKIPETLDELTEMRKTMMSNASRTVEKVFLENLLKKYEGNISQAAEAVGINRTNLHKMMKKCGIKKSDI